MITLKDVFRKNVILETGGSNRKFNYEQFVDLAFDKDLTIIYGPDGDISFYRVRDPDEI